MKRGPIQTAGPRERYGETEVYPQFRLRVSRLTNIPPRLQPRIAPKNIAVRIILVGKPPLARAKMKAMYAPDRVQKASRKYINFITYAFSHDSALPRDGRTHGRNAHRLLERTVKVALGAVHHTVPTKFLVRYWGHDLGQSGRIQTFERTRIR